MILVWGLAEVSCPEQEASRENAMALTSIAGLSGFPQLTMPPLNRCET
jgi:hypothetical protein